MMNWRFAAKQGRDQSSDDDLPSEVLLSILLEE